MNRASPLLHHLRSYGNSLHNTCSCFRFGREPVDLSPAPRLLLCSRSRAHYPLPDWSCSVFSGLWFYLPCLSIGCCWDGLLRCCFSVRCIIDRNGARVCLEPSLPYLPIEERLP